MQDTTHPILEELAYLNAIVENPTAHKVERHLAEVTMKEIIQICCLN